MSVPVGPGNENVPPQARVDVGQLWAGAVSLVIGFAIGSLLTGAAGRSIRRRPRGDVSAYATSRLSDHPG
jgi:hypothetical protein